MKRLIIKIISILLCSFIFFIGCNIKTNVIENEIEQTSIVTQETSPIITRIYKDNISAAKKQFIMQEAKFAKFIREKANIANKSQNSIVYQEPEVIEEWEEEEETYWEPAPVEQEVETETYVETYDYSPRTYEPDYFEVMGILSWGGWRWTWYSQQVLPGGGLDIPGRHVDSDGYVCDENEYICLASDYLAWGTVVNTPFGKPGRVYDCGPGAWDILDVYVDW